MKKIYTLLAAALVGTAAFAQCTINPSAFGPAGNTNYSIIPDTITNLPLIYVGTGYNTDLQFHIKPDTATSQGTFPITQVHIDSVRGIPAGFTYLPNPSSGTFTTPTATPPGTGYGCVALTGLATSGQENGGPNNDGVYPLTVYFTATVEVFSIPVPQPSTITGYRMVILPANGINTLTSTTFTVAQNAPNPADLHTQFNISAPNAGAVQFTMYNLLGSTVTQATVQASKGKNNFNLDTSSLSAGVYMCTFRMGDALVTRRITVSH